MNTISIELKIVIFLVLFFLSILIYFILFLVYSHFSRNARSAHKAKIKAFLLDYLNGAETQPISKKLLFCSIGVEATSELVENLKEEDRLKLRSYFLQLHFKQYIRKILKSADVHSIAFIIKLTGNLGMAELGKLIQRAIYKYKKSVDIQYIGLEALSKLGRDDLLTQLFNDEAIQIKLTYRAFENVFMVYRNDKHLFYKEMLDVKDEYVVRIIIKLIGNEGMCELRPDIRRFLHAGDKNIRIAVITSLGLLKDKESYEGIKRLCKDVTWEIRAAAVKAIALIDLKASEVTLMEGLKDQEWWVRYNSAVALVHSKNIARINKVVASEEDAFAKEILNYVIEKMKFKEKKKF